MGASTEYVERHSRDRSRADAKGPETAPKQAGKRPENWQNDYKNTARHRIPASRANSLLKYSALWTQPCCRRPAKPRRRRAIDIDAHTDANARCNPRSCRIEPPCGIAASRLEAAISKSGTKKITDSLE
jgi:hypothetical protein